MNIVELSPTDFSLVATYPAPQPQLDPKKVGTLNFLKKFDHLNPTFINAFGALLSTHKIVREDLWLLSEKSLSSRLIRICKLVASILLFEKTVQKTSEDPHDYLHRLLVSEEIKEYSKGIEKKIVLKFSRPASVTKSLAFYEARKKEEISPLEWVAVDYAILKLEEKNAVTDVFAAFWSRHQVSDSSFRFFEIESENPEIFEGLKRSKERRSFPTSLLPSPQSNLEKLGIHEFFTHFQSFNSQSLKAFNELVIADKIKRKELWTIPEKHFSSVFLRVTRLMHSILLFEKSVQKEDQDPLYSLNQLLVSEEIKEYSQGVKEELPENIKEYNLPNLIRHLFSTSITLDRSTIFYEQLQEDDFTPIEWVAVDYAILNLINPRAIVDVFTAFWNRHEISTLSFLSSDPESMNVEIFEGLFQSIQSRISPTTLVSCLTLGNKEIAELSFTSICSKNLIIRLKEDISQKNMNRFFKAISKGSFKKLNRDNTVFFIFSEKKEKKGATIQSASNMMIFNMAVALLEKKNPSWHGVALMS